MIIKIGRYDIIVDNIWRIHLQDSVPYINNQYLLIINNNYFLIDGKNKAERIYIKIMNYLVDKYE
jgi:hypothetical protein